MISVIKRESTGQKRIGRIVKVKKMNSNRYTLKKVLSIVVLIAMLCTPLHQVAYAQDNQLTIPQVEDEIVLNSESEVADITKEEDNQADKEELSQPEIVSTEDEEQGETLASIVMINDSEDEGNEDDNLEDEKIDSLPIYEDAISNIEIKSCAPNITEETGIEITTNDTNIDMKFSFTELPDQHVTAKLQYYSKQNADEILSIEKEYLISDAPSVRVDYKNKNHEKVQVYSGDATIQFELNLADGTYYINQIVVTAKNANDGILTAEKTAWGYINLNSSSSSDDSEFDTNVISVKNNSFYNNGSNDNAGNHDKWDSSSVNNPDNDTDDLKIVLTHKGNNRIKNVKLVETTPNIENNYSAEIAENRSIFEWYMDEIFKGGVKYVFSVPADVDGMHEYTVTYSTVNGDEGTTKVYTCIDNTKPTLTISYKTKGQEVIPQGKDVSYYNSRIEVIATVIDKNFDPDNTENALIIYKNDSSVANVSFGDWEPVEDKDATYSCTAILDEDGTYNVAGYALDYAKNKSDEFIGESFTIDTIAPKVELEVTNSDVKNGKYYSDSRIAVITVTEVNFDQNDVTKDIYSKVGNPKEEAWTHDGDKHTLKITFDEDGVYSLKFSCRDKAGNSSNTVEESEFVIDKTAPTISVNYDNNDVKNGMYYKAARTAEIGVTDLSFDASGVIVNNSQDVDLNNVPAQSGFTNNGDTYTMHIRFAEDGRYGFVVEATDLAGNKSEQYISDTFVIDQTAPVIMFEGVENYSANNGVVMPVIRVDEKNIMPNESNIKYVGSNVGEVNVEKAVTTDANGYTVVFANIPEVKTADDLYTLTAEIYDMAGNVSTEQIVFSVNRFGSVFALSSDTKRAVDAYYLTSPKDIVISEINVDDVVYREISVVCDGKVSKLKENRDYTVTAQGDNAHWKSFTYKISKNYVRKGGIYSINVYTKDKATNEQDSQSRDAKVKFVLDTTSPSIVVAGIKDECVVEADSCDVSVNVTDNMAVADMKIMLNGKVVNEYGTDELTENGGTCQFTIMQQNSYQTLEIVSHDVAGNETKTEINQILVCEKATEVLSESKAAKSDSKTVMTKSFGNNTTKIVVVGVIAVVVILAEAVFLIRRLNKKKK